MEKINPIKEKLQEESKKQVSAKIILSEEVPALPELVTPSAEELKKAEEEKTISDMKQKEIEIREKFAPKKQETEDQKQVQ
jgi:hypothetical protein